MLKFNYAVNKEIKRAEIRQDFKWRCDHVTYTELNNFYDKDLEMVFSKQEHEYFVGRFYEIYNEVRIYIFLP